MKLHNYVKKKEACTWTDVVVVVVVVAVVATTTIIIVIIICLRIGCCERHMHSDRPFDILFAKIPPEA